MPLSSSMARIPLSPYSFSAAGRAADNRPKPRNPAADAASTRSRRFSGLRRSARSDAASPALLQHVASRRSSGAASTSCSLFADAPATGVDALIARLRCAPAALRAGAVTPIRSQARSLAATPGNAEACEFLIHGPGRHELL